MQNSITNHHLLFPIIGIDNCLHYNTDLRGSDKEIGKGVETPEFCQMRCGKKPECLGFTWVGKTKSCHIKPDADNKPLPYPSYTPFSVLPGVVSGFKNCGNDIKNNSIILSI